MKLYSGKFNWHGELHHLHTKAYSEKKAYANFIRQLAEILNQNWSIVNLYFKWSATDNWKIKEGYFDKHEW